MSAFMDSGHHWWMGCPSCGMAWFIGEKPDGGEDAEQECRRCSEEETMLSAAREEGRREGFEKAAGAVDEERAEDERVMRGASGSHAQELERRTARYAAIAVRIRAMRDGAGEKDKPHVCRQCHKPLDVADGFCSDACEAEHDREMRGGESQPPVQGCAELCDFEPCRKAGRCDG